ncbi:MAG: DNA-directed RNA polymerase subunit alpha [Candidatus Yanofskybacteria bacterium RIFCSPHIGHO2_01_FULL_39_8b]|uniref:DNA-directed RNA polymerase subunit alpha n=1 Tax=Candidatus Yanofskybacteria bacterium RIFCSPHIGHO2_01_FULL_39_8b TaxID=1802659 RepID=A0A1F8E9S5_9BACT|nr:MAG: DNA-directed RNA polymerase subunit alpha [Candidatus Yanofskybacteria bacterium RIFCSPHIGHO2_01_FULL_39_8b]
MLQLPEKIKTISKDGSKATFEISPLMPGYGATIANPLRRVLLSSLAGAAVTSIKIKGVEHEFSTIPGILEDVIEIILNVKKLRFKLYSENSVKLTVEADGEKKINGKDIKLSSDVELINPEQHIATLTDKKSSFNMEIEIEKGVGYVPVEKRRKEKLPIGVIAIDAIFSPVKSVNFSVESVRLGDRIDYNKVVMEIETDGSVEPEEALKKSAEILLDHFKIVSEVDMLEVKEKIKTVKKKEGKTKKKK